MKSVQHHGHNLLAMTGMNDTMVKQQYYKIINMQLRPPPNDHAYAVSLLRPQAIMQSFQSNLLKHVIYTKVCTCNLPGSYLLSELNYI